MKPEKKFRVSDLFVTLCFLAFLFGAMAVTVVREKAVYSYYENRKLATAPEYTAQADGDGSYVDQWERYLADHAALRNVLLKAKTGLDLALHRPAVNDIVISNGHFLPYMGYPTVDEDSILAQAEAMADNLAEIRDVTAECGGRFCYVAIPNQYVYSAQAYPRYMYREFRGNYLNVEYLSAALAERGVDFLDVGAELEALGHPEDYMSRVDHHYTMRGGFLTYQLLMEKLVELGGEDLTVLREEDVGFETLPNPYLGSRNGKLLGLAFGEEHIQLLRPKEEVPFTRTDSGVRRSSQVYSLPETDTVTVSYGVYMGGDLPQTTIETNREELPSILIYGDSYTNALECILYLSFDRMDSLDLRHYTEMSLTDYIRLTRPDYVVGVRDYGVLLELLGNGGKTE